MRRASQHRRSSNRYQQGYVLLMLMLMLALMVIALAASVPTLTTQIKRDREIEMIHRGEQYARAVRRYYRKFGRFPSRMEELEKTNNIRFLRKRYKDPMTPDGSWRLLHLGDVKIGMTGSTGNLAAVAQNPQLLQQPNQGAGSLFGGTSSQPTPAGAPQQDASGGSDSAITAPGGTTATGTTSAGSPGFGAQVFGGGPIIGVASMSSQKGLHEFNNKPKYGDWLFIYDPTMDRGGLLKGPYNPNAFKGIAGGGSIAPQGSGMPNIPGVSGQGGMFGGSPSPQPQSPQPQPQPQSPQ